MKAALVLKRSWRAKSTSDRFAFTEPPTLRKRREGWATRKSAFEPSHCTDWRSRGAELGFSARARVTIAPLVGGVGCWLCWRCCVGGCWLRGRRRWCVVGCGGGPGDGVVHADQHAGVRGDFEFFAFASHDVDGAAGQADAEAADYVAEDHTDQRSSASADGGGESVTFKVVLLLNDSTFFDL